MLTQSRLTHRQHCVQDGGVFRCPLKLDEVNLFFPHILYRVVFPLLSTWDFEILELKASNLRYRLHHQAHCVLLMIPAVITKGCKKQNCLPTEMYRALLFFET